jgi:hypothetical protein
MSANPNKRNFDKNQFQQGSSGKFYTFELLLFLSTVIFSRSNDSKPYNNSKAVIWVAVTFGSI